MAIVNMLSYGTGTNQGEKDRDDTYCPFIVFRLVLRNHIIFFVPVPGSQRDKIICLCSLQLPAKFR